mmetsp:Transcript_15977/g.48000  ORF Transcript_15977/g.48000 Transcript_15977/m.48000 type:complete len:214 (+) Transcript_15977:2381-3022(+)
MVLTCARSAASSANSVMNSARVSSGAVSLADGGRSPVVILGEEAFDCSELLDDGLVDEEVLNRWELLLDRWVRSVGLAMSSARSVDEETAPEAGSNSVAVTALSAVADSVVELSEADVDRVAIAAGEATTRELAEEAARLRVVTVFCCAGCSVDRAEFCAALLSDPTVLLERRLVRFRAVCRIKSRRARPSCDPGRRAYSGASESCFSGKGEQ